MENLWQEIIKNIKEEIGIQNVKTWIDPLIFIKNTEDTIFLEAPNKFIRDWFYDNYKKNVILKLQEKVGRKIKLEINVNRKKIKEENIIKDRIKTKENVDIKLINNSNINHLYTFDTFVSGPSN